MRIDIDKFNITAIEEVEKNPRKKKKRKVKRKRKKEEVSSSVSASVKEKKKKTRKKKKAKSKIEIIGIKGRKDKEEITSLVENRMKEEGIKSAIVFVGSGYDELRNQIADYVLSGKWNEDTKIYAFEKNEKVLYEPEVRLEIIL